MNFIESQLIDAGIISEERLMILTASEEIMVNIINYAYPGLSGNLKIEYQREPNSINITFIDSGLPFNPLEKADADISLPLEERQAGGLGILMVKSLVDDVKYEYSNNKNHFSIVKYIKE